MILLYNNLKKSRVANESSGIAAAHFALQRRFFSHKCTQRGFSLETYEVEESRRLQRVKKATLDFDKPILA
jgi:uncharacterized protein YifE (UPF0438 family)